MFTVLYEQLKTGHGVHHHPARSNNFQACSSIDNVNLKLRQENLSFACGSNADEGRPTLTTSTYVVCCPEATTTSIDARL